LEYSSEVWYNCGHVNSDRLEKLQLEAARIVTGLICYTSWDSIYREAGWEKLSTRREVTKLCVFYKLNVGNSPEFLCDLIPPSVGETNNYNLRNSHIISQTTNRLSISQQSIFPSTTKLWNLLDLRIRQLSSFESFKYKLKQNAKPPSYFNMGNIYLNILHTRIRNNCSALHNDLFHANLIHSPSCSCGYSTENAKHFLLYCKRFDAQRNILYRSLLAANVHIDLNTFGSQIYNIDTNRHVFIIVQTFIKETCRFSFR
jgi:hypothetical protein